MVKEPEAIGIKEALNWVLSNGCSRVIIQSDALVIFAHVYRFVNGVAHRLARAIHSVSNVGEWIDHSPDFIVQALSEDFY
ncbi:hypothetical protein GH714_022773 [Hevea brasiliensis]|uniref:RNase H type-1 domain-containing protein n=1 Tax=Hevea brasiliensis TaxID=3981 RepID=A0A6A6LTD4_HEVBR|nr:hypothetical protein GH714_022773 [Hevea brasiliensis]